MFGFLKKKFGKTEQVESDPPASDDGVDQVLPDVVPPAETPAMESLAAESAVLELPAADSPSTGSAIHGSIVAEPSLAAESAGAKVDAAPAPAPASAPDAPEARLVANLKPDDLSFGAEPSELVPDVELSPLAVPQAEAPAPKRSWGDRLKAGLARTRQQLGGGLASLFGRRKIDEDLLEELESTLLMADCGVDATQHLIDDLRLRWKRDRLETADQLQKSLADGLHAIIAPLEQPLEISVHRPFIIMIAGVNGSGKTTSIGKLAKYFQAQGKSVLLAAGDTFRAAAREQLMTWGARNNVAVVAQDGGDAAAVIFDAISAARARNIDIVLADTAGRLPTQLHLMEEIAKVKRVIAKADPTGPHEVLLVLDANIGQNALAQVKAFDKTIGVTGLVVTKLDGTAKGGVLAAIARQCPKPLRFIGVGEGIDDLQPFKAREFVDALFEPGAGAVRNGAGERT